MPSAKTTQVTKISSSSRTVTQTFSSVQGKIGLQQSFEEISSPSRQLFLENASSRISPGWVSGHGSLFDSPKSTGSPSPIKPPKTRRSSVLVKKSLVVTSTADSFKKPAVFISPTGVKTRARRSSIYQKSGKNLLTGLDSKARRDSLAVIRSKKLVSESDYVFAVPTAESAKRKKLVSKNSRTRKAAESISSPKKSSSKKASSKSKTKGNSPGKKSVKEINLLDSKKSTQQKVVKKKSSPKKEKSVRSKAKAKTPAKEVELAEDNDDDEKDFNDENDILSPRRTRKTPGKSRKRSLSTVTKSAKKRTGSPSRSPSPAKKKKSPSSKGKSSSPQKKETPKKSSSKSKKSNSSSSKKKKMTKDSPKTSARKNSLEVSLTPLELDDSFTLKLNVSDKKKLTKKSESSKKLTPEKSAKSTTKKTPRSGAKKSSTRKTPSSNKRGSSSSKKPSPKSLEKKSNRKSIIKTTDEVAKVLEFEPIEAFDSQIDDVEIEDEISMTTSKTSPKSKTPLTSLKMKSILDSVSVPNGADKKRKTTDFVEQQSANKRRRFDMEKFEKIVASTPRDMRLDILSGRRPELSPIPGTINKHVNSLSMTKQVTIFSDKSTFLSSGPSNLSPVASTSPLIVTEVENGVFKDFVDGNDDDFDYSHISLQVSQKPTEPEPYLYDYDSDLDTSHSNVRPGCTIL